MKNLRKVDYFPLCAAIVSLVGGVLVACHLQLAGIIIAICGLIAAIVLYCLKGRLGLNIFIAYWSLVACVAFVFLSLLGFTGYTVWDIYKQHDVN